MTGRIDHLESTAFSFDIKEYFDKLRTLNKEFQTSVEARNGFFGESVRVKDNGITEKISKDQDGHYRKEYYNTDGTLFQIKESLGDHKVKTIDVDSTGKEYAAVIRKTVGNTAKIVDYSLAPNTTIVKKNFTAMTDSSGRLISTKLTDIKLNPNPRPDTIKFKVDSVYKVGDDVGHGMAHILGGPTGPENLFAQNSNVNRSAFRRVESEVQSLVEQGKKVDYEVKANYIGSNKRASSFEPKITVDGVEHPLPDDLKKIYNDTDVTSFKKFKTNVGEIYGAAHESGMKSGLVAAGITFAVSTADNLSAYIDGEISAEEMVVDIVNKSVAAGALEYGCEMISATVSHTMSKSSSALIQKISGSCFPAAVVSFAVESYDSVSAFAKGEIDVGELAYELGENAASIAGAMGGGSVGSAIGSVAGPVGTVVGGVIGSVVGAAVTSEVYATAVEAGAEAVEYLAEKAEGFMQDTVEFFEEHVPEKLEEAKTALNNFIGKCKLPFKL